MILQKPNFLRSHPSVTIKPPLPRHGLKAVGVSSMGASGEKNANCFTVSKWQIPLPLVAPSLFWGDDNAPQRGPGAAPPRGECRGAAPLAYRVTQGPPPLQSPRGGPQSPSTYTPKRTKSCIPTCNPGREKSKKGSPLPLLFCRPCAILYLSI